MTASLGSIFDGFTGYCPLLRHCERSEGIQNPSAERFWIASSQGLPE